MNPPVWTSDYIPVRNLKRPFQSPKLSRLFDFRNGLFDLEISCFGLRIGRFGFRNGRFVLECEPAVSDSIMAFPDSETIVSESIFVLSYPMDSTQTQLNLNRSLGMKCQKFTSQRQLVEYLTNNRFGVNIVPQPPPSPRNLPRPSACQFSLKAGEG